MGAGIIYVAVMDLIHPHVHVIPSYSVLIVAFVSVVLNELFFQWTVRVGRNHQSDLLVVNAWHHRADSLSSLAVLVGVGMFIVFHLTWADKAAAILVGLLIIKIAIAMSWRSICELIDTGADAATQEAILASIQATPGVQSVHLLRTRLLASDMFVDVHIQVDPHISVSEGHYLGDLVAHQLTEQFPEIQDVIVHVDIEDDQNQHSDFSLLSREVIEESLNTVCFELPLWPPTRPIMIHYHFGVVSVEIILSVPPEFPVSVCRELAQRYQAAIARLGIIKESVITFEI